MDIKLITCIFVFVFCSKITFSQITVGTIDKKTRIIVEKPPAYDSLKGFEKYNREDDKSEELFYKQYIGLKMYIPNSQTPLLLSSKIDTIVLSQNYDYYSESDYSGRYTNSKILKGSKFLTHVYKPQVYNISAENKYGYITSDSNIIGDKYYNIIQIYLQGSIGTILNDLCENDTTMGYLFRVHKFKGTAFDKRSMRSFHANLQYIIKLKAEGSNDTVYYVGNDLESIEHNIILVENFVKLKQLFNEKSFILRGGDMAYCIDSKTDFEKRLGDPYYIKNWLYKTDVAKYLNGLEYFESLTNDSMIVKIKSIWKCEVTLLPILYNSKYTIAFVLSNNNHKIIIQSGSAGKYHYGVNYYPYSNVFHIRYLENRDKNMMFFELSDYNKTLNIIENEKKNGKLSELNKNKEEQRKKESIKLKKHQLCVVKFGDEFGTLIADSKITLGMSKEMCVFAWGEPWNKSKTINNQGTLEEWSYGFGKKIIFSNDILIQIEE